jgi:SNF2 family DNA or RNA helicase
MSEEIPKLMALYGWNHAPYAHQIDAWKISRDRTSYAYFAEMGTGKTLMVLMNATYLYKQGKIDSLVVIAPKGVYRNWAENEIPEHISRDFPVTIGVWSSYEKKTDRDALKRLLSSNNTLQVLIINIEAINSERAANFLVDFMKPRRCLLVIDESTTCKNPQAKRTKIAINIGKFAIYRRICSGSPMPNGPLDLYSQTEFLQRNLLGFTNFFAFRNRFAVMQEQKFGGQQSFKRVVGYRDLDALKALMRKFSFIIKKADCLDLPPKVYQTVDIAMGPRQTEAYNQMVNDAFIQLSGGAAVTAQMVITQLLRLHQIACGFMKPDFMDEVPFGEPNERLNTLLDLLDQAPGKVIIWANYRYNIKQIIDAISEKYGADSVVSYFGDTTGDERQYAKKAFQDPKSPVKYMVSNPDTGKWGNTWTQATTVIYYSNSYNLEARDQSEDRAHRIGQLGAIHAPGEEPSVLYIDLRVRNTVDDKIVKVLRAKKKLTDEIVESNWRWLIGEKVA